MTGNPLQSFDTNKFGEDLVAWYEENKRDLPWRQDQDPYKIWVSEIMLQQTQVDTVIPYFERFITQFPTIHDLAIAEEQVVLKAWEGLGYYSRARNLLHAAREVVKLYNGVVPNNPKELERLKGIGPYTKGAILSIAFGQPEPAVDGNVMRVISRILKLEENIADVRVRKMIESYVREMIRAHNPSSYNQALMELGALICTPKNPTCLFCPVQKHCRAFVEGLEEDLPIKIKTQKKKRKSYAALLIKNNRGQYVIEQRSENGLLANLWQFPMVPIDEIGRDHIEPYVFGEYGIRIQLKKKKGEIKHVFSHLIWHLDVYVAEMCDATDLDQRAVLVTKSELEQYPFPVSHQKMMKYMD